MIECVILVGEVFEVVYYGCFVVVCVENGVCEVFVLLVKF